MQKVQDTKVVNHVKISQVQYIDEIVKDSSDRAEAGADEAEDAERTKRVPVQSEEKTHDEQSRAAPEETVPEERERAEVQTKMQTKNRDSRRTIEKGSREGDAKRARSTSERFSSW